MRHRDRVAARKATDPDYDTNRRLVRARMELGNALFERREALGLSIEALAERSGVPARRLDMIEEGDAPSITELQRLCRALSTRVVVDPDLRLSVVVRPSDEETAHRAVGADAGVIEQLARP